MNKVLEDALKSTLDFIGQSIQFILGLIGVILITTLSLSGEVLDELTTYQTLKTAEGFPWLHVAKVMVPPTALAIVGYLQHRKAMADALNAAPRDKAATMVSQ